MSARSLSVPMSFAYSAGTEFERARQWRNRARNAFSDGMPDLARQRIKYARECLHSAIQYLRYANGRPAPKVVQAQPTVFGRLSLVRLTVLTAQNDLVEVCDSIDFGTPPDDEGFVPAADLHMQLRRAADLLQEAEDYLRPEQYHTDQANQAPEVTHA